MTIEIDGRKFKAKLETSNSGNPQIIVQLASEEEIKFFAKWARECESDLSKSEYVKDIPFDTVSRQGILKNSWCYLGFNEECVTIRWDSYTYEWK